MIDRFDTPGMLLLLAAVPLLGGWSIWSARRGALRFSSLDLLAGMRAGWRVRLRWVPGLIRLAGISLLVVALARPVKMLGQTQISTEGIAIEMVIDRSASMTAPMMYGAERLTRFEVVKKVFADFIQGGTGGLSGRPGDMIGLIGFAGYADTLAPLVRSHHNLLETIRLAQPAPPTLPEGGTAIGDALALAAARLQKAEEDINRLNAKSDEPPEFTIKSKVIVLLTDGEHNRGLIMPLDAAEMARQWGIKIYTIGIGGTGGIVYIPGPNPGSRVPIRDWVDERTLSAIAETTGGEYWNARDAKTLESIYRELDQLERSEIDTIELTRTEELYQPFVAWGGALLLAQLLLGATVFRRLP